MPNQAKLPAPDTLYLHPHGYPVHIDVSERQLDGKGVAMRFELPPRGHNFPLKHQHESKLVVALVGQLQLRCGHLILADLQSGQAVVLQPGKAHRILQQGQDCAMVGVALWPGRVEHAFRDIAAQVAQHGFERSALIAILAGYGVSWDHGFAATDPPAAVLPVQTLAQALTVLPPELSAALAQCWHTRGRNAGTMLTYSTDDNALSTPPGQTI
jgi:quercetin dioxygenase-like cupin family protein